MLLEVDDLLASYLLVVFKLEEISAMRRPLEPVAMITLNGWEGVPMDIGRV